MNITMRVLFSFVIGLAACSAGAYADVAAEPSSATYAQEEIAPGPTAPVAVRTTSAVNPSAATATSTALSTNVPSPYSNMSDAEFAGLRRLTAELEGTAQEGLEQGQAKSHGGRYGESHYLGMRKSFSEAAQTLTAQLNNSPVDIRNVHMAIKAMKVLVLDIDDVFVYNPSFLHQLRNWNECKRLLRRIDGTVYREGGLRRVERLWDSNAFMRDVGKFLNVHGLLSGVDDHLHRTNSTGPMDTLVGHHGGGRQVTHVMTLPDASYHGQLANDKSAMNEGVTQY